MRHSRCTPKRGAAKGFSLSRGGREGAYTFEPTILTLCSPMLPVIKGWPLIYNKYKTVSYLYSSHMSAARSGSPRPCLHTPGTAPRCPS